MITAHVEKFSCVSDTFASVVKFAICKQRAPISDVWQTAQLPRWGSRKHGEAAEPVQA